MSDSELGVEIGKAYVFKWLGGELTGRCTGIRGKNKWVQLRTASGAGFSVPPQDVLRDAPPR